MYKTGKRYQKFFSGKNGPLPLEVLKWLHPIREFCVELGAIHTVER